jgi:hypothetical protein
LGGKQIHPLVGAIANIRYVVFDAKGGSAYVHCEFAQTACGQQKKAMLGEVLKVALVTNKLERLVIADDLVIIFIVPEFVLQLLEIHLGIMY